MTCPGVLNHVMKSFLREAIQVLLGGRLGLDPHVGDVHLDRQSLTRTRCTRVILQGGTQTFLLERSRPQFEDQCPHFRQSTLGQLGKLSQIAQRSRAGGDITHSRSRSSETLAASACMVMENND